MKMLSKIIFILLFITLFTAQIKELRAQNNNSTKCSYSNFENQLDSLVGYFGYKSHKWPENEQEMTKWCRNVRRDKPLAKKFTTDCMKGMGKTLGSMLIYSYDKVAKLSCRNKIERSSYIARGKCGNIAKRDTMKCWNSLGNVILNLKKLQQKDKLPTFCCTILWWRDCTVNAYRKVDSCTEENADHMEQQITRLVVDPMNMMCSDSEDSDKCEKYAKNFDFSKSANKYKTFFPPLFDFFETL